MDTNSPMLSSPSLRKRFRQPMIRSRYLLVEYDVDSKLQVNGTAIFFIGVFLSITLLLFLYARWAIRRCRHSPPPLNSTTHAAVPKPTLGLDPVAIDGLPVVMYSATAEASPGAECCICLGIFGDAEEVKILPRCRHCYHSECVDEWLKNQSSCPLCRDMLRVDSLVWLHLILILTVDFILYKSYFNTSIHSLKI